ncbi:acetylcholine receptor subunit alpha-type acr-16 isoform X2 [Folsomia candida]|uniref:acetylcholine receptor subunit alpha-type acr-16 isoform X2 n=1 Tax=Folsomia candida TaxID=158441 RepID=UPI001604D705|nr:acetylcholine receptor subunit alpha-type acr-16 isoform X2 [Folsomia candida]XP_035702778.1 acetylcholine receptor subunit alpha-type acr-16 isoform X2 [Folsomia candida]XP_035702779.1 acetylcholine receptor subunit alpha-type acr-16 isoform X2 [Folsomia candida]
MRQIVLLILSSCCLSVTEGADVTDISRLRQDLLRNYDKNARPVQSHQNTTVVKIYFFNYGFEFDENTRLLTLHCLVALIWKDELIHWDPLLYGNLSAIQFYPTEVWRPDILVYNSYEKSELDHFGNTLIHAQSLNASNSILLWVPPASLVVECDNVDFYRWPYDKQRCSINLTAWAHDGSEISLQVQENHTKARECR